VFKEFKCVCGEAPLYRPEDNTLHFVDPLYRPPRIYVVSLDHASVRTLELEDNASVLCFRKNRAGYIAAYYQGIAYIDESGAMQILKEVFPSSQRHLKRFNDGAVDCKGRFWAGEIDLPALEKRVLADHHPTGRLFRYDPDGTLTQHETGIMCSNGIGWSPDNGKMYYNDSSSHVMYRYDFDLEHGTLSNRIIFVDKRQAGGNPDGLVVDTLGNVWTAIYGKGCVEGYSSEGQLIQTIPLPTKNSTCPGWAGKDLSMMFITSAENEDTDADASGAGDLFVAKGFAPGLPKFRFG